MGGVNARFAEGELFSCATTLVGRSSVHTKKIDRTFRVFMHTFYQKPPRIGIKS
jgi:hypothetical protein